MFFISHAEDVLEHDELNREMLLKLADDVHVQDRQFVSPVVAVAVVFARENPWHGGPPIIPIRDPFRRVFFYDVQDACRSNPDKIIRNRNRPRKISFMSFYRGFGNVERCANFDSGCLNPWSKPPAPKETDYAWKSRCSLRL